ncbi:MMPL family transporter [Nocardioides sp. GXZ039]|uniref:MMPL family transporter n=1 Tax=Nocardioides sp. GXZ039 TaxID=3136018 RepID=UPI0030F37B08
MATYLYRLGKTAYRRWPLFLAAWLAVFVVVGGVAATLSKPTTDAFTIPGIPSEEAADLQAELFPDSVDAFDQATVNVVVAAPEGEQLSDYADDVAALVEDLRGVDQMPAPETVVDPVAAAAAAAEAQQGAQQGGQQDDAAAGAAAAMAPISQDGRIGVITFAFDVDTVTDVKPATQEQVKDLMAEARDSGLTVEANGQGMGEFAPPGGSAELIGIGLALIILVLTFGSLVAAGLPIVSAIVGVGLGMAGITASTAFMDVGSSAPILATMIGLAVGIDYSLFILARYRSELEHTEDREEAVGVAVGTSGSAVVFAGLTVLIALAALAVVRIPFLTTMGIAAAATVFLAVLVALTLLPAILGMLKSKAFGGQVRKYRPKRDEKGRVLNNGVRWARFVGKKPVVAVLLVVVGLGALAIPLKDLFLAFPTDSTASPSTTQRKASDLLTEGFGPGREAPFQLVVDLREVPEAERAATTQEIVDWAASQDGVAGAVDLAALTAPAEGDPAAAAAAPGTQILLLPEYGPDEPQTKDLLEALRGGEGDIEAKTDTDIGITGLTAITTDVSDRLNGALVPYLAVVVGLAFILLMIVFRSLLVPLTATFGFLLSVLATLGFTVLIFQEGTFGIMEGQPIVSFMPIFLIGVVFGLAMDYQVFLVTRMREAHVHGASTREAVVDGFRSSARVVAAAAVIMTAVFSGFILEDDAIIKSMGFALAVAVIFDAFVVRMVLIPALMYLLGEKAWYLPAWLDKILPNVDVEGEKLDRAHMSGLHGDDDPDADLVREREPVH